jgi:hypothetical protein
VRKQLKLIPLLALTLLVGHVANANTRTLEMRFALSADSKSEFSRQFPVLSAGRIVIEANWSSTLTGKPPGSLTLVLIQPDGAIATSKKGTSILRIEHRATEEEVTKSLSGREQKWTAKILNDSSENVSEVSGTLRITVPANSRALEDTQFTLLGSGNAQEIPFNVPAPGRVQVDVSWTTDTLAGSSPPVVLIVSFIHPGESRTYARRQGPSPISVEHQVTEQALDRGGRWVVRVQNDTQTKVNGRIKITYTPSL